MSLYTLILAVVKHASDSGERGQACCTKQKCSTKHPAYPHDSHNSGEHVHCIFALYMRSLLQNSARSINLQKDLCLKAMSVGKGSPHINLNPNKQWALLKCNPRSPGLCFCPATSRSGSQRRLGDHTHARTHTLCIHKSMHMLKYYM